ncbi:MAG TPA: CPBP family glutamic-type intramembrane protease [Kofleriaceae bacterium]|jgi:hypothetical protein|nr:CPBP family glutamic-type intramembrane protease [Kofleriaceae bacterium]
MASVPLIAGLLVVATVVNWLRKHSWAERVRGPGLYAAIGAGAGLVALVLALVIGTPAVEGVTDQAVQWSAYPVVRGSVSTFVMVAIVVAVGALATELVLRGFVVELGREFTRSGPVAVLMGALAEGLLAEGDASMKLGAGVFGLGLGAMYIASGRSVLAPLCARLTFLLGALVLEALRVVG